MTKRRPLRPAFILTTTLAAECLAGADAHAQGLRPNSTRCPATPPPSGGACPVPRLEGNYRPGIAYYTQRYTCLPSTRRWSLVEATCNPPEPPPPPPPPPPTHMPPGNPPAPTIILRGNPPPPPEEETPPPPVLHRNPPRLRPR